jgi:hypothetical protein
MQRRTIENLLLESLGRVVNFFRVCCWNSIKEWGKSVIGPPRQRFVFVICSDANLALAATTFCVSGRRGIRLYNQYL